MAWVDQNTYGSAQNTVIFVDSRVEDANDLVGNAASANEIVYLDPTQDGLAQMRAWLNANPEVGSVQIVGHGSAGDLWLGTTYLSHANADEHAEALGAIGASIAPGGDILIYACDTAKGETGAALVATLAELTGRDIAASDNRTGLNGDWQLEIQTGSIEARPVLSATTDYGHDLATLTVTSNADSGAGTLRQMISDATAGDTITFSSGMTINLSSLTSAKSLLLINKDLIIDGDLDNDHVADVTLDGGYNGRVLEISSGTVTLDGLVVQHGLLAGDGGGIDMSGAVGGSSAFGAGIWNAGNLTLNNVSVSENAASGGGGGGGIAGGVGGGGGGGGGGAIGGGKGGDGGSILSSGGSSAGTYVGEEGSPNQGGDGGSYDGVTLNGRGGSYTGGSGGSYGTSIGGGGGSASNGSISIGGGGGGGGYSASGGHGGDASGGIFNAIGATLTVIGTSAVFNNVGAGGGGGGGGGYGGYVGDGGDGGRGVGGIWNEGTAYLTAANYTSLSGNAGSSGSGGLEGGPGVGGQTPIAVNGIYNLGTLDTNYIDNSAPEATDLTQTIIYDEDAVGVALDDIVVSDADAGETITAAMALSDPAGGTLTTGTFGSVTSTYNAGTGLWTASGSVTDVNEALAAVTFTPSANWDLSLTISTQVKDAAGAGPTDGMITLDVTPINDAPTATNLTQSKSATEGGSSIALDDIVVTDVDTSDTITATLTLSDSTAGTLSTATFGSATSTYNAGTGTWTVTGSTADVNAALAAVALTPSANNDDDFGITTQIRDAAGTGPTNGTITVDITPVNDAPVLTMSGGVKSADEGLATVIDSGLTVSDIDSTTLASATVAITGNFQSGEDGLAFANDGSTMGNIAASYNAATGTMTLTSAGATATVAQWEVALRAVTYTNTSDTPSTSDRTTSFAVSDGSADSDATRTVSVVSINDAPVIVAPASIDAVEGEAKVLTGIAVSDVDAGSGSVTVTLSAPAGTIAATSGSNVTVGGTASALTLTGTIADINEFIASTAVSYTPPSGSTADVDLTVSINDGGNAGTGGAQSDSEVVTIDVGPAVPTVTDGNISISGASGTGGAFKIGDTVTATWNNTGGGDNNADTISAVNIDFSQFGGGAAVAATNSSGTWTATYTIVSGAVDTTNRNVSVTATNSVGPTTTADTTNATVDAIAPTVTDANVAISGGTGAGGAYTVGDTVTATWNNTAGGDNNSDTISGATIDFSQFGGGTAVATTNSSGTWTATYTITAGTLDQAGRNVAITATDNAGNTTTTTDTTNAAVDNETPTVTDGNLSISGGSGAGGAFIVGDTVTATWDNTAMTGDNNSDALSAVTVDFSAFGGGSTVTAANASGIWTAVHTITAGSIEAANVNVAVTVTDDAGNAATVADSSNASVDTDVPTVGTVTVPANGTYTKGETLSFDVTFDEAVTVDTNGGIPRLAIALNTGGTAYADYVSGSDSTALVFELEVASGQVDKDGIEITALEANGASLTDASGNATDLTLNGVADTSAVLIDAPASSGGGGDEDEDDGDTATTPTAAEVINATPPADGSPITITGKDGIDEVHIAGSVILGEGLENAVISGTGDYTVETNDLDNIIYGNVGDTTIYASAGRDFIDGGYGDNTVVFDGESSEYAVRIVDGVAQVTTLATGDVTTIANVSVLQFEDGEQPLFATGQGMVAGFYEAFLGRELDQDGFEYWMGRSANGMDAFEMVQHFIAPPEFGERTESLTSSEFVEWLYVGFLDREPDATGMAYWIDAIDNGTSYADAAANFVFAEEVGIRIDELIDRNDWLHIV